MTDRKAQARNKAAELRAAEEQAQRRRALINKLVIGGVIAIAVVLIAVMVILSKNQNKPGEATVADKVHESENLWEQVAISGSSITIGDPQAAAQLSIVEDFACPHCVNFEHANGQTIKDLVSSGELKVVYHGVSIMPGTFTKKALNATWAVANHQPEKWAEFHSNLFGALEANNPSLSDNRIVEIAEASGVTNDVALSEIRSGRDYWNWIDQAHIAAVEKYPGFRGTPYVWINDRVYNHGLPADALRATVAAINAGEGIPEEAISPELKDLRLDGSTGSAPESTEAE